MAKFELSSKKYKNGRRKFTAALYELQSPSCVVDDVGTLFNKNGITFLEEYAIPTLESIKDMSVRVSFVDEERTVISDHGMTGIINDMPVFENATTVGHFIEGYIADIELNGEIKRCVCGKGYLDEMCYPAFVQSLDSQLQNGTSVEGSIEIYKTEDNNAILYKKGWIEEGRIPTEYMNSGWDMVINPADESSTLVELNNSKKQNKEEQKNMEFDMNELKTVVHDTICETNSKNNELTTQISELNSQLTEKENVISEKNATISELNASVEKIQKVLDDMSKERETYWAEREILEKELAKAKVAEKLAEVDSALAEYNETEKDIAKEDIDELKKNINACEKKEELNEVISEINSIESKICMSIVANQKKKDAEAKIAEQNSAKNETKVEDIFSEMCELDSTDDEDVNIF